MDRLTRFFIHTLTHSLANSLFYWLSTLIVFHWLIYSFIDWWIRWANAWSVSRHQHSSVADTDDEHRRLQPRWRRSRRRRRWRSDEWRSGSHHAFEPARSAPWGRFRCCQRWGAWSEANDGGQTTSLWCRKWDQLPSEDRGCWHAAW